MYPRVSIESFKQRVRQGSPTLPTDSVIDYLLGHYHGQGTVYSPTRIIHEIQQTSSSSIIDALNCLCGDPYRVLERHWTYYDLKTGNCYDISDVELDEAACSGTFNHPATGEAVDDFVTRIGLHYISTADFESIITEQKKKTETRDSIPEAVKEPAAAFLRYVLESRPNPRSLSVLFTEELFQSVERLQQSANYHRGSSEDALTDALLAPLRRYDTLQRDSNSNGHVDFFFKAPITGTLLLAGEAKLHCSKGISWYEEGLIKLTDKYSQSSSSIQFALLIYYFRERNFFDMLKSYRDRIEAERKAHFIRFGHMTELGLADDPQAFISIHNSHGRELSIVNLWIRLFSQTDTEVIEHARQKSRL